MPATLSGTARNFLFHNAGSPVVYGSVEGQGCTYRLANGRTFRLSSADCQHVGHPRWAHIQEEQE